MKIKHAEVIKALAEGKDIEYKTSISKTWVKFDLQNFTMNPISCFNLEWRVCQDPLARAGKLFFEGLTPTAKEMISFRAGWEAMGEYLVDSGLIEQEDLPGREDQL